MTASPATTPLPTPIQSHLDALAAYIDSMPPGEQDSRYEYWRREGRQRVKDLKDDMEMMLELMPRKVGAK